MDLVIVKALCILHVVGLVLINLDAIIIFCWYDSNVSAKDVHRLFDDVNICFMWLFVKLEPWIHLDANQSAHLLIFFVLVFALNEKHDVAIGLFCLVKALLLYHLSVVHKAYELPISKVDDALWSVLSQMQYCYLIVLRIESLVSHQRIVDNPSLTHRLLVIELVSWI